MKKKTIVFLLISLPLITVAQTGFVANSYYGRQYYIEDIPVGPPYPRSDYFGNYIGTYQTWKTARWHFENGGHSVLVWNGFSWVNSWQSGYYYWFDWYFYERRVY